MFLRPSYMIYSPAEDSWLLAKEVEKYAFGKVLDMGSGSGVQAEAALKNLAVKDVLAVDINPEVIKYVEKIDSRIYAVQSDLFNSLIGKFDTIVFNPPYLPKDPKEDEESALATTGGEKGYEVLERFIKTSKTFLKQKGRILITFSSLTDKTFVNKIINEAGYDFVELAKQKISFEELYVYALTKK